MHRISIKKVIVCLVSVFMLVTCTSCKAEKPYMVSEYLNYLSNSSGIDNSFNIESNFNSLEKWGVVIDSDIKYINDELNYAFLSKTICNLIEEKGNPLGILKSKGWINKSVSAVKKVNKGWAQSVVDKAVNYINNKTFESKYEYRYRNTIKNINDELYINDVIYDDSSNSYKVVCNIDENDVEYRDAEFEDVFSYLDIEDSFTLDLSNSEVIPLQKEEIDTSYINNKFTLLASKNHVFNKDGFRISYSINSSGLDVHVSKKVDKLTIYGDASINSIKPSFKWTYDSGDLKNCYFNIKMNTTSSLGVTIGKYGNYYLKFKDLDSSSFINKVKSMFVPKADEIEAEIPICQIKTPIPSIPFEYINMTVGIKLYASGKAEIVIYNSHNIGFETKNGNIRYFWEHNDDFDGIIRASAKSAIALNVGLDATEFRLCDIELDGGLKSEVSSTIHLYDTDFNKSEVKSDIEYSTLEDISKDNPYVKVCGDVSLYWLLDLLCNTSKSVLYKMGFSKTFHILDDNNQVFGNLHHIENGQFVKSCTRKGSTAIKNNSFNVSVSSKIVLNTTAEVLLKGETFNIEVVSLPENYALKDIKYISSDTSVAIVENGIIKAIKPGSSKINVHTSDGKYNTYINILVSTS